MSEEFEKILVRLPTVEGSPYRYSYAPKANGDLVVRVQGLGENHEDAMVFSARLDDIAAIRSGLAAIEDHILATRIEGEETAADLIAQAASMIRAIRVPGWAGDGKVLALRRLDRALGLLSTGKEEGNASQEVQ